MAAFCYQVPFRWRHKEEGPFLEQLEDIVQQVQANRLQAIENRSSKEEALGQMNEILVSCTRAVLFRVCASVIPILVCTTQSRRSTFLICKTHCKKL